MSLETSRLATILELEEKGDASYPEVMDGIMKDLERKGLIVRTVHPDAGTRHARLTEAGRKALHFLFEDKK